MNSKRLVLFAGIAAAAMLSSSTIRSATTVPAGNETLVIETNMAAPKWAQLERQLLSENVPAAREFFKKYFDDRGNLQAVLRWGADDGPDDAFENFNHWPELNAMGASDEVQQMYLKGHESLIKQYTVAKTTQVPAGRQGMYYKEFHVQQDWMHHGEGLQLFNRMALSLPDDPKYRARAQRFAGFYIGEDPEAPNYDPEHRIIRSLMNGSRGPLLRQATAIDWVGDPFDPTGFVALHAERNFNEMLAHYEEYQDVVGDSFLNLVATTLPTDAYLVTHDEKYRRWIVTYMDAWLERMQQNNGIIPSFVDLDGKVGGRDGKWWGNAYGWGFSPVNPVTGKRENRNRVPRALVGFSNALLMTGQQKYVDAWRHQIETVNANARTVNGQTQYPTMFGASGWYGWQNRPWDVGALETWYWSMKPADLTRIPKNAWLEFLQGRNPSYPETAVQRDLAVIQRRLEQVRADRTPPEKRLADNMLDYNPVTVSALLQLTLGALEPGREGGLLNARLRYFDPVRKRAGLAEDTAALISELTDTETVVTLVNLSPDKERTIIVQGGAYAEHQIESVEWNSKQMSVNAPNFTVKLRPGSGGKLKLRMRRYANRPTVQFPWNQK
jgi:ribosomal protein S18 acetylase RimI-like enzyme